MLCSEFNSEMQGCGRRLRAGRYRVLFPAGATDVSVTTKGPHQFGAPRSLSFNGINALP
jgi:hypothetical protein